MTIFWLFI